MLLIVEGMDRCGKSTLIEKLRKNYFTDRKIIVNHCSSPPKGLEDPCAWELDHYEYLFSTFTSLDGVVISDRFHLGAIVYGAKYRGMDPQKVLEVESKFVDRDIVMVTLVDYGENIAARDDGESQEANASEFELTRKAFNNAFISSRIPHRLLINVSEMGMDMTYPTVADFLDKVLQK